MSGRPPCKYCSGSMEGRRPQAKTCSDRCRREYSRLLAAERAAPKPEARSENRITSAPPVEPYSPIGAKAKACTCNPHPLTVFDEDGDPYCLKCVRVVEAPRGRKLAVARGVRAAMRHVPGNQRNGRELLVPPVGAGLHTRLVPAGVTPRADHKCCAECGDFLERGRRGPSCPKCEDAAVLR